MAKRWTMAQLQAALVSVRQGAAVNAAAREHGVPYSTLQYHLAKDAEPVGPSKRAGFCVLSEEEEQQLVEMILQQGWAGKPPHKNEVLAMVSRMVSEHRVRRFGKSGKPGRTWWMTFLARHADQITMEGVQVCPSPQRGNPQQAQALAWQAAFKDLVASAKLSAEQVWNMGMMRVFPDSLEDMVAPDGSIDLGTLAGPYHSDSGLPGPHDDPHGADAHMMLPMPHSPTLGHGGLGGVVDDPTHVLDHSEDPADMAPHDVEGSETCPVYVFAGIAADGSCTPPAIVFQHPSVPSAADGTGPAWSLMMATKRTPHRDAGVIIAWLRHFVKFAPSCRPLLVIVDCVEWNISDPAVQAEAKAQGIEFFDISGKPPRRAQPLDVAVFGPLRYSFRRSAFESRGTEQERVRVTSAQVPDLMMEGFVEAYAEQNVVNGFRKTGIWALVPLSSTSKGPSKSSPHLLAGDDSDAQGLGGRSSKSARKAMARAIRRAEAARAQPFSIGSDVGSDYGTSPTNHLAYGLGDSGKEDPDMDSDSRPPGSLRRGLRRPIVYDHLMHQDADEPLDDGDDDAGGGGVDDGPPQIDPALLTHEVQPRGLKRTFDLDPTPSEAVKRMVLGHS